MRRRVNQPVQESRDSTQYWKVHFLDSSGHASWLSPPLYFPDSSVMLKQLLPACLQKAKTPGSANGRVAYLFIWNTIRDHIHSCGLNMDVLKPSAVNWMAATPERLFQKKAHQRLLPEAHAAFGYEQAAHLAYYCSSEFRLHVFCIGSWHANQHINTNL